MHRALKLFGIIGVTFLQIGGSGFCEDWEVKGRIKMNIFM